MPRLAHPRLACARLARLALAAAAALAVAPAAAPAHAWSCLDLETVCRTVGVVCEKTDFLAVSDQACHSLG
jgi:hypothetical protein